MRLRMRWALASSLVLMLALPAQGGDGSPPKAPAAAPAPLPPTLSETADAVLAALATEEHAVLRSLAVVADPDSWFVVDTLIRRGHHDAAERFARAAPRIETEALGAYVSAQRGVPDDPARRKRLSASSEKRREKDHQGVLDALGPPEPGPIRDVLGIWMAARRGDALAGLSRPEEAATVRAAEAEAAERVGWVAWAAQVHARSAAAAYERGDLAAALASYERALPLQERRGSPAGVLQALRGIAGVHVRRGDLAPALASYERALPLAVALGDRSGATRLRGVMGSILYSLGSYDRALEALSQARTEYEALGDRGLAAAAIADIGSVHDARGEYAKALAAFEEAHAALVSLGDRAMATRLLGNIGTARMGLGEHEAARSILERVIAEGEALGDRGLVAVMRGNLAQVHAHRGDHAQALLLDERAMAEKEAVGDKIGAATTLRNIASHHRALGDYARALAALERSQAAQEALGNPVEAALALASIGSVHFSLGDYGKSLSAYEAAFRTLQALGDGNSTANLLASIGNVHHALGDHRKALAYHERAHASLEALGDLGNAATALANIGADHYALGDYEQALLHFERARAAAEAAGNRADAAIMLGNVGKTHHQMGDHAKALRIHERTLEILEESGDKAGMASVLCAMGQAQHRLGDLKAARVNLDRAVRTAKSLRAVPILVDSLRALGELHLAAGAPARALAAAREGLTQVERLLGGLGEEEGARARGVHSTLFGVGAVAAAREEDPAALLEFLESGRAGALLDTLGKRDLLRWKAEELPEDLRAADLRAQAAHAEARRAYDRVQGDRARDRRALAAARDALEAAEDEMRAVNARIAREAKRGAEFFYPRAKTLEEVQAALEDGEALVLYGLCLGEALALVVRPDGETIVPLGERAAVEAACGALDLSEPTGEPGAAIQALEALLVEPLGLGSEVKRVLVSPDGPLGYLPFGALFDVPVVLTPSGTTHVLLQDEEREPGEGILALGDPDYAGASEGAQALYYRGRPLLPLPATRAEAEAIGTKALLGAAATEDGLRAALAERKRWRALHLACHGLVDPERPTLSSLALARGGEEDGFLTALEVLHTRIPADLAVLSACETAKGRVMQAEGIVGLARAFMYAGTPRVVCSLWKVDDQATAVLMKRFYEVWNASPATSAAEALRQAQEHVRGQERWKHPYYWAAWVLWGLP